MFKKMTKKQAEKEFKETIDISCFKELDKYAQRVEWDIFTDNLCKDGGITLNQFANWMRPSFIK